MGFRPVVHPDLKIMDTRLFDPRPMGYAADLDRKPRLNIPARLQRTS
jgi:acyl CoA:acetate/3-ketoacid CoA transferase